MYKVSYQTINWNAYYGGNNDYIIHKEATFADEATAKWFIQQEVKDGHDKVLKRAGDGRLYRTIEEIYDGVSEWTRR